MDGHLRAAIAVVIAGAVVGAPALAQTEQSAGKPLVDNSSSGGPKVPAAPKPAPAARYLTANGEIATSQLIGTAITNDQNQQIGSISDVLLDKSDRAVTAVLSVGGFLGVGSRLVAVPFSQLQIQPDKVVLPGATKVSLENLPAYDGGRG